METFTVHRTYYWVHYGAMYRASVPMSYLPRHSPR